MTRHGSPPASCNILRRIGGSKIHGSSLLLCLLMFWWTLGAMRVPGPSTSSTLSPRAVHFMELGCWTFPVFLWWSVLRLAINSSVTGENWLAHLLRLDQEEWRRTKNLGPKRIDPGLKQGFWDVCICWYRGMDDLDDFATDLRSTGSCQRLHGQVSSLSWV